MTITFKVDDVKSRYPVEFTSRNSLGTSTDQADYITKAAGKYVKKLGLDSVQASKFTGTNQNIGYPLSNHFVETVYKAYSSHKPLAIGPDELWLVIAQAVAKYIELNAEAARHAIVNFEGKKVLLIERNDFVENSPDNDWEGAFGNWSDLVGEYLGKRRDMFDPTFGTTTPTTKAAIQAQMLAALAPYFEYRGMTMCGIPSLTLYGDVDDWNAIHSRVLAFKEFLPPWISDPLEHVACQFLTASKGTPDLTFWQSFFKTPGGSGGTPVNGLINKLFPYVNAQHNKDGQVYRQNPALSSENFLGPDLGDFGASMVPVPFTWNYHGKECKMRLITGLAGTYVDNGAYRSVIGWAVGNEVPVT